VSPHPRISMPRRSSEGRCAVTGSDLRVLIARLLTNYKARGDSADLVYARSSIAQPKSMESPAGYGQQCTLLSALNWGFEALAVRHHTRTQHVIEDKVLTRSVPSAFDSRNELWDFTNPTSRSPIASTVQDPVTNLEAVDEKPFEAVEVSTMEEQSRELTCVDNTYLTYPRHRLTTSPSWRSGLAASGAALSYFLSVGFLNAFGVFQQYYTSTFGSSDFQTVSRRKPLHFQL
jgi:hypothetical protein